MSTAPRPAATVVLLRDARPGGPSGLEVFMVQRNRRSGFLPNAWVFPGGRVDAADALHGHPGVRGRLAIPGVSDADAAAIGVAAVRETLEEAGVWLGEGTVSDRDRALPDLLADGAAVDLDRLRAWSWWVTPEVEPKRFDTRFLVALASHGEARHDDREVVDSRWVSPRAVIDAGDQAAFPLAPPTWWTLRELAAHADAASAFAAERPAGRPIQPVMEFGDQGLVLLLPGHPAHPEPAVDGLPDRITAEGGRWVAWSGSERR
jgi:8-oxo-dGTP pyrophosphatase MutT (NUDIX family)